MASNAPEKKHKRALKRKAKAKRLRVSRQNNATAAFQQKKMLEQIKLQLWKQQMMKSLEDDSLKSSIILDED